MRSFSLIALIGFFLAAPAVAQVTGDVRTYTNSANAAINQAQTNVSAHILDGAWTRNANAPGVLVMQTGPGQTLTGTYSGKPCHGTYFQNSFTLFCEAQARTAHLITGRATRIEPQVNASVAARVVGAPARIEGRLAYLVTGLTPDGRSSEVFRVTRD